MNCEQVFDQLTRGPLPCGDPSVDEAVESHLAACHDCRALAEALRPAVGLFHEALADDEPADLPCYRGLLTEDGAPAVAVAAPPVVAPRSDRDAARTWWVVIGGVCLLAGIGVWISPGAPSPNAGGIVAVQRVEASEARTLEEIGVREECVPDVPVHDSDGRFHQCCTVCHSAGSPQPTPAVPSIALISRSCSVCHVDSESESI